ncbi:MAG: hypothetical protein ABJP91_19135 [Sneathiella sp.]
MADAVKLVSNDGEAVNYVHSDPLGGPMVMTDQSGSGVWDRMRLPFVFYMRRAKYQLQ